VLRRSIVHRIRKMRDIARQARPRLSPLMSSQRRAADGGPPRWDFAWPVANLHEQQGHEAPQHFTEGAALETSAMVLSQVESTDPHDTALEGAPPPSGSAAPVVAFGAVPTTAAAAVEATGPLVREAASPPSTTRDLRSSNMPPRPGFQTSGQQTSGGRSAWRAGDAAASQSDVRSPEEPAPVRGWPRRTPGEVRFGVEQPPPTTQGPSAAGPSAGPTPAARMSLGPDGVASVTSSMTAPPPRRGTVDGSKAPTSSEGTSPPEPPRSTIAPNQDALRHSVESNVEPAQDAAWWGRKLVELEQSRQPPRDSRGGGIQPNTSKAGSARATTEGSTTFSPAVGRGAPDGGTWKTPARALPRPEVPPPLARTSAASQGPVPASTIRSHQASRSIDRSTSQSADAAQQVEQGSAAWWAQQLFHAHPVAKPAPDQRAVRDDGALPATPPPSLVAMERSRRDDAGTPIRTPAGAFSRATQAKEDRNIAEARPAGNGAGDLGAVSTLAQSGGLDVPSSLPEGQPEPVRPDSIHHSPATEAGPEEGSPAWWASRLFGVRASGRPEGVGVPQQRPMGEARSVERHEDGGTPSPKGKAEEGHTRGREFAALSVPPTVEGDARAINVEPEEGSAAWWSSRLFGVRSVPPTTRYNPPDEVGEPAGDVRGTTGDAQQPGKDGWSIPLGGETGEGRSRGPGLGALSGGHERPGVITEPEEGIQAWLSDKPLGGRSATSTGLREAGQRPAPKGEPEGGLQHEQKPEAPFPSTPSSASADPRGANGEPEEGSPAWWSARLFGGRPATSADLREDGRRPAPKGEPEGGLQHEQKPEAPSPSTPPSASADPRAADGEPEEGSPAWWSARLFGGRPATSTRSSSAPDPKQGPVSEVGPAELREDDRRLSPRGEPKEALPPEQKPEARSPAAPPPVSAGLRATNGEPEEGSPAWWSARLFGVPPGAPASSNTAEAPSLPTKQARYAPVSRISSTSQPTSMGARVESGRSWTSAASTASPAADYPDVNPSVDPAPESSPAEGSPAWWASKLFGRHSTGPAEPPAAPSPPRDATAALPLLEEGSAAWWQRKLEESERPRNGGQSPPPRATAPTSDTDGAALSAGTRRLAARLSDAPGPGHTARTAASHREESLAKPLPRFVGKEQVTAIDSALGRTRHTPPPLVATSPDLDNGLRNAGAIAARVGSAVVVASSVPPGTPRFAALVAHELAHDPSHHGDPQEEGYARKVEEDVIRTLRPKTTADIATAGAAKPPAGVAKPTVERGSPSPAPRGRSPEEGAVQNGPSAVVSPRPTWGGLPSPGEPLPLVPTPPQVSVSWSAPAVAVHHASSDPAFGRATTPEPSEAENAGPEPQRPDLGMLADELLPWIRRRLSAEHKRWRV
jgi:hypothetical protein